MQKVKASISALRLVHALDKMLRKFSLVQERNYMHKYSKRQKPLHQVQQSRVNNSIKTLKAVYRRRKQDAVNEITRYKPNKF